MIRRKDAFAQVKTDDLEHLITSYLSIANAEQFTFFSHAAFMTAVNGHAKDIQAKGIKLALSDFLGGRVRR